MGQLRLSNKSSTQKRSAVLLQKVAKEQENNEIVAQQHVASSVALGFPVVDALNARSFCL